VAASALGDTRCAFVCDELGKESGSIDAVCSSFDETRAEGVSFARLSIAEIVSAPFVAIAACDEIGFEISAEKDVLETADAEGSLSKPSCFEPSPGCGLLSEAD
jgi:hypothetical protein